MRRDTQNVAAHYLVRVWTPIEWYAVLSDTGLFWVVLRNFVGNLWADTRPDGRKTLTRWMQRQRTSPEYGCKATGGPRISRNFGGLGRLRIFLSNAEEPAWQLRLPALRQSNCSL